MSAADDHRLEGKVAIVAGGGSQGPGIGIGRAVSISFARRGATVAVVDIDGDAAERTVTAIERDGGTAFPVLADVTDDGSTADAVAHVAGRAGGVDALVNVVGIVSALGTATDLALDEWDRVMRVNVRSIVSTVRHAVPQLALRGGGSIVNLASNGGLLGVPGVLAYSTSKGAILNLTRCMAVDHGHDKIRVNCIAAGPVVTPAVERRGLTPESRRERQRITLLDVEGTPWDIAAAAAFLVSDDARWITGSVLVVDGGISAALRNIPIS